MPPTCSSSKLKTQNSKLQRLVPLLLRWFELNARDLPWRRTRDPYAIWVSEVMLQQTQVKTVLPYWERWMRELPTLSALARARPEKIHKLWEGLGYYSRVRNLQQAAKLILERHRGRFPERFADVLALPGIGRYTAGAICSIAFNHPTPILDGNVIRVLTRIFGIAGNPREKKTNALLWDLSSSLVANSKLKTQNSKLSCSRLNQSLMELGALICTPRSPECQTCPANKLCVARHEHRVEQLPNLGRRVASTPRRFRAFIFERAGRFFVRRRPAGVVNAHLWEFPNIEVDPKVRSSAFRRVLPAGYADRLKAELQTSESDPLPQRGQPFCIIRHSITRYRITLEAFRVNSHLARGIQCGDGRWLRLPELKKLSFPSAHKKIIAALAAAD